MPDEIDFRLQDGAAALQELPELTDIYREVYAEPPYHSGPLWDTQSFAERTGRQANGDGFSMTTARLPDGVLIGYSFGLTFPAGRWWSGDATPPSPDVMETAKFAVIELLVRQPFRGRGIGRRLLDDLLAGRIESYAILTAVPDAPARDLYRRWGWQQVGTAHHTLDSPVLDSLVLPLHTS
jgi:GNAT superfamily N-acetyltransferase